MEQVYMLLLLQSGSAKVQWETAKEGAVGGRCCCEHMASNVTANCKNVDLLAICHLFIQM
jgi:hypothetical protein